MPMSSERRHFSRITMDRLGRLSWDGHDVEVQVQDISLNGALLRLPAEAAARVRRNADYHFTLVLGFSERIEMSLRQVHQEDDLVGFHCHDIDLDSISQLRRLVELNLGNDDLLQRELAELVAESRTG
jgi:hypothetical protein